MANRRAELAERDVENLMLDPRFLRFISTTLETSGMLQPAYGADGRNLPYMEGRRSLGFDILSTLEAHRPDALVLVLQAELTALKENPDDKQAITTNLDTPAVHKRDRPHNVHTIDYSVPLDDDTDGES